MVLYMTAFWHKRLLTTGDFVLIVPSLASASNYSVLDLIFVLYAVECTVYISCWVQTVGSDSPLSLLDYGTNPRVDCQLNHDIGSPLGA